MGASCSGEDSGKVVEKVDENSPEEKAVEVDPKVDPKDIVTVKVVSCRGLRNADWTWIPGQGVSDAYVIARVGDKEILRTKTIPNTLEPVFDEEFACSLRDITANITFDVFDSDPAKLDDKLGSATLKIENVMDNGFNGEIELVDAANVNKAYIKVMVKLPEGDYPAGPTAEFKVTLPKKAKNSPIGFEVDKSDPSYLFIVSDGEKFKGPAKEHNDKAETWTTQLRKMQSIFAVNGVSGDADKMEKELKAATEVTLTIRRFHVFTIAVEKKGPLGAAIVDAPTSCLVTEIKEAKDSPIQVWNENHKAKEVKKGDRIIEVNGKMGKGKELTQMMKKDGQKQIVFLRPASPDLLTELWHSWF